MNNEQAPTPDPTSEGDANYREPARTDTGASSGGPSSKATPEEKAAAMDEILKDLENTQA